MSGGFLERRIPLPVLLVPIGVSTAATMAADWTWPGLVNDAPLLLLALSAKNRFLLLTAPQLGLVTFLVVGALRLLSTDPIAYVMGRQHGDKAVEWIERKSMATDRENSGIRKLERLFARAAPLCIVVAPSALFCLLAGAAKMRASLFIACNVLGTIGRLLIFWLLAERLKGPLESTLEGVESAQVPLLVATVGIGAIQLIRSRRRAAARRIAATNLP